MVDYIINIGPGGSAGDSIVAQDTSERTSGEVRQRSHGALSGRGELRTSKYAEA